MGTGNLGPRLERRKEFFSRNKKPACGSRRAALNVDKNYR